MSVILRIRSISDSSVLGRIQEYRTQCECDALAVQELNFVTCVRTPKPFKNQACYAPSVLAISLLFFGVYRACPPPTFSAMDLNLVMKPSDQET